MRYKDQKATAKNAGRRRQTPQSFYELEKVSNNWISPVCSSSHSKLSTIITINPSRSIFSPLKNLHKWSQNGIVFAILTLSIIILFSPVVSAEEDDLVCQKGVSGFPGATFPRGDILLREGDTLEVYCRLNLSKTTYNASFIQFIFTKANISKDLMKTSVINETTALLQVKNMNVSSPHLSCVIAPPGAHSGNYTQVCQNEIDIGYPPRPVENFRCIAPEWRSLNCTWTKPHNPIPTNYALELLAYRKSYRAIKPCPNTTKTPTSCTWGPYTDPFYIANMNPIQLRINGSNVLNASGIIWTMEPIDHWAIVVPEAPVDLKAHVDDHSNITVSWTFKNLRDFPPGLYHEIKVCAVNFTDVPCRTMIKKSSKGSDAMEHILTFPYAYVNYSVGIRMRSQRAKDEEDYWSKPSIIMVTSKSKSPTAPPKLDVGSYESVTSTPNRTVYLYWEEVSPLFYNGPHFHYIFSVVENEVLIDIQPKEITKSYAKFTGLSPKKSYRFHIMSANAVGNSSSVASVFVPYVDKAPGKPTAVSKLDFTNGSFEVSWNPPEQSSLPIISYTIFRCISSKPRPYQCQGLVVWDVVDAAKHTKVYNYLPHHNDMIYQFAVSANAENMSSGMTWASCILIHDKVPAKLKNVQKKSETEKEIEITWQLECSYKPGVIDGFKITYCMAKEHRRDRCIDNEKTEAVSGAGITTYKLKKLQPCSTYMIAVAIITSSGEMSQKSDPIFASTQQSAPSNPPEVWVNEGEATNTSAVVTIKPTYPLNGVVEKYKITYKSVEGEKEKVFEFPVSSNAKHSSDNATVDVCFNDDSFPKQTKVEIKGLASNTNYTYRASVCTVRCSEESESGFFKTDIGSTDMNKIDVSLDDSNLVIKWIVPDRRGGPINYFEILTQQNGEDAEIDTVDYQEDISSYTKAIKFLCESDTNLTAQVRAVTELRSGEVVRGSWSTQEKFACGGGTSRLMWVGVFVGAILAFLLIGIGSIRMYKYLRQMREFDVKLPPGLAVQGLDGFSHMHTKRTRKNSEGDTQSFSKELGYPLQIRSTHTSDDTKDLASSTESCLEKETAFDNKVFVNEMDNSNSTSAQKSDSSHFDASLSSLGPVSNPINLSSPISPPSHEDGDNGEKQQSQSLTKPLLDDSQIIEDSEESSIPAPYSPIPPLDTSRLLSNGPTTTGIQSRDKIPTNSRPIPKSPATSASTSTSTAVTNHVGEPDVLISSGTRHSGSSRLLADNFPSSSASMRPPIQTANSAPPPPSSSYVKWTQMVPEQFTNGETSLGLDHSSRKAPYCQVGIL